MIFGLAPLFHSSDGSFVTSTSSTLQYLEEVVTSTSLSLSPASMDESTFNEMLVIFVSAHTQLKDYTQL